MKFRVLFLKKVHILYLVLALFLCLTVLIVIPEKNDTNVFITARENQILKADFTGDGKEDILYINTENDKYHIQINSRNKDYYLLPERKLNSMGYYYPYSFMKINLLDITRDRIPEIFIQSTEKGTPIQHIFFWDGIKFKDIFCSSNNILGVVDSKNNKTPMLISSTLSASTMNLSYFMCLNSTIERIQFTDELPGKTEITGLINYIQSLPYGEVNKPSDIFYPGITGKDLDLIGKLAAENKTYKFTDGFFTDTRFNKNGEALEYKWILNFKSKAIVKGANSENLSVIVRLKKSIEDGHPFKIVTLAKGDK